MRRLYHRAKMLVKRLLRPILRHFYLLDYVFPQEEALRSDDVRNVRVLIPAHRVRIASMDDPFVPVGRFYNDGWFDRPDVTVSDIPEAYLYVKTGMACTRHWKVIADLEYRLPYFEQFERPRPRHVQRVTGTCATVSYCWAWNHYHWMVDCLPKLISLTRAEPATPITIIASDELGPVQRETLAAILPANFTMAYYPPETWLQVDKLVWSSLLTGRCNSTLPEDYVEAIRRPILEKFQLPPVQPQAERLYITRRSSQCRRVLNEDALVAFLERYGFRTVALENLSFREQVTLFHRAEIVLGPHGAGFNLIFFSGKIKVVVFHPDMRPQNHFHSLACALGQEHYFLMAGKESREENFEVDLAALQRIFDDDLKLPRPD